MSNISIQSNPKGGHDIYIDGKFVEHLDIEDIGDGMLRVFELLAESRKK